MKKTFLLYLLLGHFCGFAQIPSTLLNSVVEKVPKIASNTISSNYIDVNISTRYIDGFGRSIQKNLYRASPDGSKDLIFESVVFDTFGREKKSFLTTPYPFSSAYVADIQPLAQAFYQNDPFPYSENIYENSPLKRVIETYGVGQAWRSAAKSVKTEYSTAGGIRKYIINATSLSKIIQISGTYPPNSLFKTTVTNERNISIIEYKDDEGRIIEIDKQDDTGFIKTAYVYDDFGRLAYIIQPKTYELSIDIDENSDAFKEGVFAKKYDKKNRIIEEHSPSTGWTYFVYNAIDQVVLSQNARQRQLSPKQWDFKKYDAQNREIYEGIISDNSTRANLQLLANDAIYETKGNVLLGYTNAQFPTVVETDVKLVNYFDSYTAWKPPTLNFKADSAYHTLYPNARGLATGQKIRNTETNAWTIAVSYYDNKNQVIQELKENLLGGINVVDYKYNFSGEIIFERSTIRTNIDTVFRKTENVLDHVGRTKNLFFTANSKRIEMASFQYDAIGRMIQKKIQPNRTYQTSLDYIYRPPNPADNANTLDIARRAVVLQPGTLIVGTATNKYTACINPLATGFTDALQTIDYQYNIRGQLNCTNCVANNPEIDDNQNDLYSMKVDFHEDGRFYDGNISSFSWQSRINRKETRKYIYDYDKVNRIKNAKFSRQNSLENYSLNRVEYDKSSNITKLVRNGATQINATNQVMNYGMIDSLFYDYQGISRNKVAQITDYITTNPNVNDFRDSTSTVDYDYYDDGSLKADRNKRINQINYNYLGLTEEIILTNNRWIKYYYDATGQKTKKITSSGKVTDYVGDLIYTGTQRKLYQFSQPEGRATPHPTIAKTFLMEYQYADHLGNLQLAYRDSIANPVAGIYPPPIVVQENHTDPFGITIPQLSFSTQANNDKFVFGSHENQDDFGLGLFDMQSRMYDPSRGQLNATDLSAANYDSYSPYVYVGNNPVMATDPDGRDWYLPMLGNGLFGSSAVWFDGNAEIKGFLHLGNENYVFGNTKLAEFEVKLKKFEDPVLIGFKNAAQSFKSQYQFQKFETDFANQDRSGWETRTIRETYKIREQIIHNGTNTIIAESSRSTGATEQDNATAMMMGGWAVKGIGAVAGGYNGTSKIAGAVSQYSDDQLIQSIANRANNNIAGSGSRIGTLRHTYAEKMLNRYQSINGSRGMTTEASYLAGSSTTRGTLGSVRLDVFQSSTGKVWDYKFYIPANRTQMYNLNQGRKVMNNVSGVSNISPVFPK